MTRFCANEKCRRPIPSLRSKRAIYCCYQCAVNTGVRAHYRRRRAQAKLAAAAQKPVAPREPGDLSPDEIERRYQAALAVIRRRRVAA